MKFHEDPPHPLSHMHLVLIIPPKPMNFHTNNYSNRNQTTHTSSQERDTRKSSRKRIKPTHLTQYRSIIPTTKLNQGTNDSVLLL